jgi:hypothetical protein
MGKEANGWPRKILPSLALRLPDDTDIGGLRMLRGTATA